MGELGSGLMIGMVLFGIILAIAWVILPFALIGTKPLLRELIKEQKSTNELLRSGQPATTVERKNWN